MYVSPNRSTIPCAQDLTFPFTSRQSSKSIPAIPCCAKNANARPEYLAWLQGGTSSIDISPIRYGSARRPSSVHPVRDFGSFHPPDCPAVEFARPSERRNRIPQWSHSCRTSRRCAIPRSCRSLAVVEIGLYLTGSAFVWRPMAKCPHDSHDRLCWRVWWVPNSCPTSFRTRSVVTVELP